MALGSGLIGMGNAPGKRRKEEDEILAMAMGPRREMPKEEADINTGRFAADTPFKPLYQPGDKAAMNHAKNREGREVKRGEEGYRTREFEYELDKDPLWQQYISSARRNGQNAMTDTMAKVASQTGGIAGSYAVSAGAGAYNDYMQRANDVIPELEQIAYQKYQDELQRDLAIKEMDDAKRLEKAEYNAAISKGQRVGASNLSDDERRAIYLSGNSWIDGDKIYTPEGELSYNNPMLDSIISGFQKGGGISSAEENYIRELGYWIDDKGDIVSPDGTTYSAPRASVDELLYRYMAGGELSPEEKAYLMNSGYEWRNGSLYLGDEEVARPLVEDNTGEGTQGGINTPPYPKTPSVDEPVDEPIEDKPPEESKGATPTTIPEAVKSAASALGNATKPPKIEPPKKPENKGTDEIEGTVETMLLVGKGADALNYLETQVENKKITEDDYANIIAKFGFNAFGLEA